MSEPPTLAAEFVSARFGALYAGKARGRNQVVLG